MNRENAGQYGVEQFYQEDLAGEPRVLLAQRDANGRAKSETSVVQAPGVLGEDLRLTIDAGLQLALEQELLAAWIADDAKSVSAVVLDPYTGEVYAEATYPSYDANDYRAIAADGAGPVHRPGRVERLRARFRVQDDDRDDRPRGGHRDAHDAASRTSARSGSTVARPRSTTPTARAWAG